MAFGRKTGGRPKGVPNKLTRQAREGVLLCYRGIGGDKAFKAWAKANPDLFYTKIYAKVIEHKVEVDTPQVPLFAIGVMPSVSKEDRG